MRIFQKETLDYIASRFRSYYHGGKAGLTYRDAVTLIDYASSPCPAPTSAGAINISRPHVSGGGRIRPTKETVDAIIEKSEKEQEIYDEWADVFGELIRRCEREPEAEMIIKCAFEKQMTEEEICKAMGIHRGTYHEYRNAILSRAAVLAIQDELIIY